MKAKTLIVLGIMVVLAMMVVPVLARAPVAATALAPSVAAPDAVNLTRPQNSVPTASSAQPRDPNGIEQLVAAAGGKVQISVNRATGLVSFVAVSPDAPDALSKLVGAGKSPEAQAYAFFAQYGALFGIAQPATELALIDAKTDQLGTTRVRYRQMYQGVPVFAGILQAHFNAQNQLTAVNGASVPDITVSSKPRLSAEQADQLAVSAVSAGGAQAAKTVLYIYRTGLAEGVKGISYLAYEVEVTNGVNVREFVIVDAQSGKIIDRWSAVANDMIREVYSGTFALPAMVWKEGDPFPYTGVFSNDINNLIYAGAEVYNTFSSAFGRDSYDAAGAIMRTVNNDPGIACPNANWNGTTTNYCNGVTSDDVVAHEWGHAYTEYTDGLIYAWQPGALNESYSDIWGETIDLINGRGTDVPGGTRTAGTCSAYSSPRTELVIQPPSPVAGSFAAQAAAFGPPLTTAGVTGTVVLADNGSGGTLGCTALGGIQNTAAITGNIALIDRGTCTFAEKVKNAQVAGAIAVIIANNASAGLPGMGGSDPTIVIPSLGVAKAAGDAIKANSPLTATLRSKAGITDDSYRWLMGEDSTAFGEAIRDMWEPNCYGDPGKVTDTAFYVCDAGDSGGVHTNSGVSNHTYALLVDGGTYNGHTVASIGLTKAAHLYWRAQSVYQTPTTGFVDHADALEASCNDLVAAGIDLPALSTSISTTVSSGQVFTTTDCLQVAQAIAATELRTSPAQCNFQPLLKSPAPALCAIGTGSPVTVFTDTFEIASGWTVSHTDVFSTTAVDWLRTGNLPGGRSGQAFYGNGQDYGSCSGGVGDASRVLYLASPVIALPADTTIGRLAFDHYVATESGWDGGNLQISVNGGAWQSIAQGDFTFNPYNAALQTVGAGNTNPLAGQRAFTGADGGQVTGSWGRSMVNISAYAHAGDSVQLRYRFGADGCGGIDGWYVDDVQVYYCAPNVSPAGVSVDGPTSGLTSLSYAFTATVVPPTTTLPLAYYWEGTDLTPVAAVNSLFDVQNLSWLTGGTKNITVTAGNLAVALSGANEVPPNASSAIGTAEFQYDPATRQLSYQLMQSGILTVTAAHIHRGSPGVAGPVAYPLNAPVSGSSSGVVTLTVGDEALMFHNGLYVNVHSTVYPGGELRAQVGNWSMATHAITMVQTYGQVAMAHLAPFADTLAGTAVTVTVDSMTVLTDVVYGLSTGYLPVPAGPHLVEIYPAGSASPAITGTVNLLPDKSYSVIAIGDGVNQPLSLLTMMDDTTPVAGAAKVRIGHLAPFAAGSALADVRMQDGTPILTNVMFSLVSPYLTLPAGTYDLKITAPGGAPTLIDPLPVTLNSNDILSVFATGDGTNQALGAFAWPSNQMGFFLPLVKSLYLPLIAR